MADNVAKIKVQAVDEASSVFDRIRAKAKELNKEETASGSKALERIIKGGGAAAGVSLAGEALKHLTTEAVEFQKQMREGTADVGAFVIKMGEGLPIIGGFVTAGKNIREMFTHEQADIDAINNATKAQNHLYDLQQDALKRIKEEHRQMLELIERMKEGTEKIGKTARVQEYLGIEDEYKERERQSQDRVRKKVDERVKVAREAQETLKAFKETDPDNSSGQLEVLENAVAQTKKLMGDAEAARKAAEAEEEPVREASAERRLAQEAEWQKKHGLALHKAVTENNATSLRAWYEAGEEEARAKGLIHAADLQQIERQAQERIEAIKEKAEEEARLKPEMAKQINDIAASHIQEEETKKKTALREANKSFEEQAKAAAYEAAKAEADARGDANVYSLQKQGKFLDAQKAQLIQKEKEREAEIAEQLRKNIANDPENAEAYRRQAAAQKSKAMLDSERSIAELGPKHELAMGASGEIHGHLSGAALISREKNDPGRILVQHAAAAQGQREKMLQALANIVRNTAKGATSSNGIFDATYAGG